MAAVAIGVPALPAIRVQTTDVVVAGGGIAGLAAAISLRREGLRVRCIEPIRPPRPRVGAGGTGTVHSPDRGAGCADLAGFLPDSLSQRREVVTTRSRILPRAFRLSSRVGGLR